MIHNTFISCLPKNINFTSDLSNMYEVILLDKQNGQVYYYSIHTQKLSSIIIEYFINTNYASNNDTNKILVMFYLSK